MSHRARGVLALVAILLAQFIFYFFITKPHFEESFSQWKLLMGLSGSYTKSYHHFNDLFLWQWVFEWLYALNAGISWFPVALFLFSWISIAILALSLFWLGAARGVPVIWLLSALFFLSALLGSNLLWIHQNRAAFLMCASAITLFTSLSLLKTAQPLKGFLKAGAFLWFVGGLLLRVEAGTAVAVLLLPSAAWLLRNTGKQLLQLGAPAALIALLLSYYFFQITTSKEFYFQIEPELEYELKDRANVIPLSAMKTSADSARYEAVAQNWMLGDVRLNTVQYMRSLANKPTDMKHRLLFFLYPSQNREKQLLQWSDIRNVLRGSALPFALMLTLLLLSLVLKKKEQALHIGLFMAAALILLAATFSVNAYNRVLEPLTGIALCWSMLLFLAALPDRYETGKKLNRIIAVAMLLLVVTSFVRQYQYYRKAEGLNKEEAHIENRIEQAIAAHPERNYFMTAVDFTFLQSPALHPFTGFHNKTFILPEIGQYSGNHYFLKTIGSITGCAGDDFVCRMQFIEANKKQTLIVGKERRLKLYERYMKHVYDVEMNLTSGVREPLAGDTYFWLP